MKKTINISIGKLVEAIHISTPEKDYSELESKISEMLLKAVNNVNIEVSNAGLVNQHIDELAQHLNSNYNIPVEIEHSILKSIVAEIRRLQYHEDTTIGLYAIDRKPKEVSYKWIKKEAFRIKKTDNVL